MIYYLLFKFNFVINFNRQERNETQNPITIITHALFIDSTWNQSKGILKDPMISGEII